MDFVSWDDDIPNIYGKKKSCSKPKQNRFPNVEPDPVSVVQFLDLLKGTIENYSSG
jgi:hypothetical protein